MPAVVRSVYSKVRGFFSSMVEMEMNAGQGGAAAGARGGLGGMFSKCSIF